MFLFPDFWWSHCDVYCVEPSIVGLHFRNATSPWWTSQSGDWAIHPQHMVSSNHRPIFTHVLSIFCWTNSPSPTTIPCLIGLRVKIYRQPLSFWWSKWWCPAAFPFIFLLSLDSRHIHSKNIILHEYHHSPHSSKRLPQHLQRGPPGPGLFEALQRSPGAAYGQVLRGRAGNLTSWGWKVYKQQLI